MPRTLPEIQASALAEAKKAFPADEDKAPRLRFMIGWLEGEVRSLEADVEERDAKIGRLEARVKEMIAEREAAFRAGRDNGIRNAM